MNDPYAVADGVGPDGRLQLPIASHDGLASQTFQAEIRVTGAELFRTRQSGFREAVEGQGEKFRIDHRHR